MRGYDNFSNSKQYILEQLLIYDYTDESDLNILKMKIWALDGTIRDSESIDDTDVDNPKNHYDTLMNDLTYLDKYIRTEEDTLNENEQDFDTFYQSRINSKVRFLNTKKPDSEEYYQDYEQSYNQRPTALSKSDFAEIYSEYLLHSFNNAFEITTLASTYSIDYEISIAENNVLNHVAPSGMSVTLLANALSSQLKNDKNYVLEMNDIYDEILDIIKDVKPAIPGTPWVLGTGYNTSDKIMVGDDVYSALSNHTADTDNQPGVGVDWETYWELYGSWSDSQIILCNVPEKRLQIVLSSGHSSHRGPIIETLGTGGYRFKYRDADGVEITLVTTNAVSDLAVNNFGELEDDWDDWTYAHYYNETTTGSVLYIKTLIDKDSLSEIARDRFDILNERWANINRLREYQIMNNGTRNIIESMVNAVIPDMLSDKEQYLSDKIQQKEEYTDILTEKCVEFI